MKEWMQATRCMICVSVIDLEGFVREYEQAERIDPRTEMLQQHYFSFYRRLSALCYNGVDIVSDSERECIYFEGFITILNSDAPSYA